MRRVYMVIAGSVLMVWHCKKVNSAQNKSSAPNSSEAADLHAAIMSQSQGDQEFSVKVVQTASLTFATYQATHFGDGRSATTLAPEAQSGVGAIDRDFSSLAAFLTAYGQNLEALTLAETTAAVAAKNDPMLPSEDRESNLRLAATACKVTLFARHQSQVDSALALKTTSSLALVSGRATAAAPRPAPPPPPNVIYQPVYIVPAARPGPTTVTTPGTPTAQPGSTLDPGLTQQQLDVAASALAGACARIYAAAKSSDVTAANAHGSGVAADALDRKKLSEAKKMRFCGTDDRHYNAYMPKEDVLTGKPCPPGSSRQGMPAIANSEANARTDDPAMPLNPIDQDGNTAAERAAP